VASVKGINSPTRMAPNLGSRFKIAFQTIDHTLCGLEAHFLSLHPASQTVQQASTANLMQF
jgi:hypothetical protein